MDQRISLVTLGVRDLHRAQRFYESLGWTPVGDEVEGTIFYQAGGMVLGLWGRDELAADTVIDDAGGWGGITLAQNVGSPEAVDALLRDAEAAGGTVTRQGGATFWGGYNGVFLDTEGHAWEIAHNPFWTITDDGRTLAS
ncbi:VOC family protein [Frondihabitans australicus]|uniref:VOC domain-containing protein n=1 Tax=Frondihabitans australicus TaxID=386892 RepID=A0A495IEZ1_9MICO|nr:VOC family protein [Frondihabitans australicus]RKR74564.1 hypothetical protein C8E83_1683 [Frondihabitans australicus]